mgnify:FL=1|jgi:hypothetical protein
MRQLFICTSKAVLAATGTPQDLTKVAAGTIGMWENDDDSKWLAAAPASDFSIAYGRPNSQAVVIPIDFTSARVTTSTPQAGTMFKAEITIPEPVAGKDYTLQLIKLGTEKHERYSWTVTDNGSHKTTAAEMAKSLGNQFTNMIEAGNEQLDGLKVTVDEAKVTIEAKKNYQGWNLIAGDDLVGTDVAITAAVAPTLDAAYVKNLASFCSQNRGFSNVYRDGASIYPGYPMEVENTTYKMYSIQFKYPRKYGRTRDEAPIQELAIVVPVGNTVLTGLLDTILAF